MPVMRVLSHITLKSKIHLLNYSGIWYTAWHPHITEKYWSYGPRLCTPRQKILRKPLQNSRL